MSDSPLVPCTIKQPDGNEEREVCCVRCVKVDVSVRVLVRRMKAAIAGIAGQVVKTAN